MNKHKYLPCFNCYKYYYDTGVKVCFASFPCSYLAYQYIDFYDDCFCSGDDNITLYVKKETVAKFL